MTPLALVLAVGATYRLTLLVVDDQVTAGLREWARACLSGHAVEQISGKAWGCRCGASWAAADEQQGAITAEMHVRTARATVAGWRGYLLTLAGCPWCVSMWVAFGVLLALPGQVGWWPGLAAVLTASGATGILHRVAHP